MHPSPALDRDGRPPPKRDFQAEYLGLHDRRAHWPLVPKAHRNRQDPLGVRLPPLRQSLAQSQKETEELFIAARVDDAEAKAITHENAEKLFRWKIGFGAQD